MTNQTLRIHQFGRPEEVLKLEETAVPEPKEGQVLIQMRLAPINPADINFIQGTYGVKPELPALPGNEGVGIVQQTGAGVARFQAGEAVRPPEGAGTWRQFICADAEECLKLPDGVDESQLAMLYVNPPTAWRMLHDFVELQAGDWVIQNAANSAVGRCVIQIARAKGWRTVNLIRRPELVDELKALGGDAVLLDDENVKENLGDIRPKLGLNAVGGESATRMADCLEKSGALVTYGAMSRQAVKVPNKFLIFKDISFRGFWMTQWYRAASRQEKEEMLAELGSLLREGQLSVSVEKIYPLDEFAAALTHAQQAKRSGKILLQLS